MISACRQCGTEFKYPPSHRRLYCTRACYEAQQIAGRNAVIDFMVRDAKKNRWRLLCWVLPHAWHHIHLFDDEPDYSVPFRGASNYAGVCLRCGKRDLFRGPLKEPRP